MVKEIIKCKWAAEAMGTGSESAQSVEFVQMTDPVTQSAVMVPKNLEQFIGHITSAARNSGRKAVQEDRDKLQDQIDTYKDELESMRSKMKDKSESKQVENLKTEYDKIVKDLNGKMESLAKEKTLYKTKYEEHKTSTDLIKAISDAGITLNNQLDAIELLKMKGKARQIEQIDLTTGQGKEIFDTILTLEIPNESGAISMVDLKPGEAVEKFFKMPQHEYLVKNKLSPGGGTAPRTGTVNFNHKEISTEKFESMNPKERAAFMESGGTIKE